MHHNTIISLLRSTGFDWCKFWTREWKHCIGDCNPSIHCILRQCLHPQIHGGNCENVGVRCEQKIVKSVSAANVTTPNYGTLRTVLINVILVNNNFTNYIFHVECYNQQHGVRVNISVSNEGNSFTTQVRGLFPSSFYTCCTSALSNVYEHCQKYIARGTCITIKTPEHFSTFNPGPVDTKMTSVSLVGGILGSMVAVLLIIILLLLSVIAFVLRPDLKKYVIPKTRYVHKTYCSCPSVGVRHTVL